MLSHSNSTSVYVYRSGQYMLDCCVNSIHSSVSFSIRSRCYADRIASALWTDACRVINENLQHNSQHQSHTLFNLIYIVSLYCIKWLYSFIVPKLIHYPSSDAGTSYASLRHNSLKRPSSAIRGTKQSISLQ